MSLEIKCFNNVSNKRFFFPGDFHMFMEYFLQTKVLYLHCAVGEVSYLLLLTLFSRLGIHVQNTGVHVQAILEYKKIRPPKINGNLSIKCSKIPIIVHLTLT